MIEFKRISPALVANPEAGGDVLFLDAAGVYYTKDENGNLTVLGNGISGIAKVGTAGLVDTYEIEFTSGVTYQYTVTNAKSIVELVKLGTSVLDSTYRITFNDGPAFEYVVKDGRGIANIEAPPNAGQPNTTDTYTVRYNDGTTSTFIVRNGRDGLDGLVLSVNGKSEPNIVLNAADVGAISAAEKGAANGVATLGADSKIPAAQLPSFVDDVLEFANLASFPATGETGKIYVAIDTGFTYRWSGSQYIEISAAPVTQVNGKVGNVTLTTSDIAEGTNLYFTAARVRDTILTGLSLATNAAITAADTVLSAFGKLQKQLTDHFAAVDPHPQYNTSAETTTQINDALAAATADTAPGAIAANSALGTSTQFAREDHTHAGVTSFNGRQGVVTPQQADYDQFFTTPAEAAAAAPVQSFNGRTGAITPQQADYDAFFTTPAEAAAAAPVQSFNGRTGAITPQQADYDQFFTTTAEAAAAAPVQSVAGKTGAVTLTNADVGLGNVKNPVVLDVRTTAPQTLNQTLTAAASVTIPANSLVAGDAFEIDVLFGTLVNTTAASNLEVAVFINGTQNAIAIAAMGTTAVAAPGRGGRAFFKVVFRSVGAAGTALANGTIHVNALANFASNQVAVQTVNTTANITLDVRVRTSAATTTGTVQIAAIEQCT